MKSIDHPIDIDELMREIERYLAEDLPTIPLFWRPSFLVQRTALSGPTTNAWGRGTWNVEEWRLGPADTVGPAIAVLAAPPASHELDLPGSRPRRERGVSADAPGPDRPDPAGGGVCAAVPDALWPPTGDSSRIEPAVAVEDGLSRAEGFLLTSVAAAGADAGDIEGFDVGTADTGGSLRAERGRGRAPRRYALGYRGADRAGNTTECVVVVDVRRTLSRCERAVSAA